MIADASAPMPFQRSLRLARNASPAEPQRLARQFMSQTLDAYLAAHQRRVEIAVQDEPIDIQMAELASWLTTATAWKIGAVDQALTWLALDTPDDRPTRAPLGGR